MIRSSCHTVIEIAKKINQVRHHPAAVQYPNTGNLAMTYEDNLVERPAHSAAIAKRLAQLA